MADIIQQIQFKRGTKVNLETLLVGDKKPKAGEPIFEMDNNRLKIGDGIRDYASLPYLTGEAESRIVVGYYFNGFFFKDSTYQESSKIVPSEGIVYIDLNSNGVAYTWSASQSKYIPSVKTATEEVAGIMKLYKTHGANEDGTMTQKAITEGVKGVQFVLSMEEEECLEMDNPFDDKFYDAAHGGLDY